MPVNRLISLALNGTETAPSVALYAVNHSNFFAAQKMITRTESYATEIK